MLAAAGYSFSVDPAEVDESVLPDESPGAYVERVARAKADVVAARAGGGRIVLAADTTVVAGSRILGKPSDEEEARAMLTSLSGCVHRVLTAVVARSRGREASAVVATRVRFLPLTAADIEWYLATGEPMGKAGAYAIQGRGARFVDWIEGSWSNVVGLPVATVDQMLKRLGR